MAVIIGHFQICNSISLGCFNWQFTNVAKIIRSSLFLIMLNEIYIAKVVDKYQVVKKSKKKLYFGGYNWSLINM